LELEERRETLEAQETLVRLDLREPGVTRAVMVLMESQAPLAHPDPQDSQ